MKGTTILLLGAATLVAYASAHPHSKITEGGSLPDKYNFKRTSSSSNSNSYSQSNHDEQDVSGAYLGKTFSGSKSSGSSSSGGSHSQSSSFSSSSFNGNIPLSVLGGGGLSEIPQQQIYGEPALALGNPGTAGLGLSNQGSGFSSGSSSYGGNSASSDDQISQVAQGAGLAGGYGAAGQGLSQSGLNQIGQSGSLNSNTGIYGANSDGSYGQQTISSSGLFNGQSGSQPGSVQYWWSGPDSPFGAPGKPSGGCNSNGCSLSGHFDLNKGSGGAHASNQGGQVELNINGGNPFLSGGNAGSGFVSSSAGIGQNAQEPGFGYGSASTVGSGSGSSQIPIQGSSNPFLNGGYAGGSSGSSFGAGSGSFASSNSGSGSASAGGFASAGNPFLKPGSGPEQVPLGSGPSSTAAPGYSVSQGSTFGNNAPGSINPFFKPGSGSVVLTPPVAGFPGQSDQEFPQPSQQPGFQDQSANSGSSGSFGSVGTGDFQGQFGQVPSFPSQSTIGSGGFPTIPTSIPDQQQAELDDGLSVSCSGEGRICVQRNLCVNGIVREQGLLQVKTGTQFCKTGSEVCCTLYDSGSSTTFGGNQGSGSGSSSTGSFSTSTGSFSTSAGKYGGISSTLSTPTTSGSFGQSAGNQGLLSGQYDQSANSGSSGIFGQSGSSDSYDQSQQKESTNFGSQGITGSGSNFGSQGGIGSTQQQSGLFDSYDQTQQKESFNFGSQSGSQTSAGSSSNFGNQGSAGSTPLQSGLSGSYDQSQQKESFNFGSQSNSQGSAGSGSSFGNRDSGSFPQRFPPVFGKPTGGSFNGGNTGSASASANANANAAAGGQAGSSISGTRINNNGKNPGPLTGGLFGSADNSGEDLSAGEPSFGGAGSRVKGSTASNGYLPPYGSEPSSNVPAYSELPKEDTKPTNFIPQVKQPFVPAPITVQVGCAAALICVEERFCTLEGVISPQPVALTPQQIERRAPLSSCKNPDNGIIGKCCRDPNYVDPWPTGNLPANYSGGFDEQGFPTYLNYAKTHPPKKRPATKNVIREPIKGFPSRLNPNQPKGWLEDAWKNFTSNPPQINFPFWGQPSDKPTVESPSESPEGPAADGEVTDKPATASTPGGFFGFTLPEFTLPNFSLPTLPPFTLPPNPFQPQGESKNYDSSASNESPAIIAPHTPGVQCGLRNKVQRPSGLVYDDVGFGEIPWQAMVLSTRDRKLLCSGAFVSANAVVTAAHCVDGFKTGEVSVKAGEWKLGYELKHEEPLPFEIVAASNIVSHPGFRPGSPSHDLAILFLEHPVKLDQHVDFLCLGDIPQPKPGRKCISTGWGKIVLQTNVAGALMHGIDVDLIPQEECRQRIQGAESQIQVDNTLTCVKAHKQRNNMCQVDVGGPLACDRGDGFYELTGVYSQETGCLPTNQVATFALIDTNWVKNSLAYPPQVPSPNPEIGLPNIGESSNVQIQYDAQVQQPAKTCDCQKSNLPGELNQYLPPV